MKQLAGKVNMVLWDNSSNGWWTESGEEGNLLWVKGERDIVEAGTMRMQDCKDGGAEILL